MSKSMLNAPKSIEQSKMFRLLCTFDRNELKRFEEFLDSPFFNKRTDVIRLFDYLRGNLNSENPVYHLDIVLHVFKNNNQSETNGLHPSDETRLRNCMSTLNNLAESYLVADSKEKLSIPQNRKLIDILMTKKLYKHARNKVNSSFQQLENSDLRTRAALYDYFLMKEVEYQLNVIEFNRSPNVDMVSYIDAYRNYFLGNFFLFNCSAISRTKHINSSFTPSLAENLIRYSEEKYDSLPVIVQLYYLLFLILNEQDKQEENFNKTRTLLFDQSSHLDPLDIRQVVSILLNIANNRIREGKFQYIDIQYQLYAQTLPTDIWTAGLYFSPHHFYRIVSNAIENNKSEYAKQFINANLPTLNPKYREDLQNLCEANYYLAVGEYDKSQEHLSLFFLKEDVYYTVIYKTLYIKLYYEKGEYELLLNTLNSFRVFLDPKRNNDWSETFRASCKLFLKIAKALTQVKFNFKKKENLHKHFDQHEQIYERVWLSKKLTELNL